jgi:hypothetical protein
MARASSAPIYEESAERKASRVARVLPRIGYVAKGVVYATVGILALMTVFGFADGKLVGVKGAIGELGSAAAGQAILVALAVGLAAFAVWRFYQAVKDPDRKGGGASGIAARAGFFVSGLIYLSLAAYSFSPIIGSQSGGSGGGAEQRTATLMSQPFGPWLVGIVGAILIIVGLVQAYRSYSQKFREHWREQEMSADERRAAVRVSRIGIAARAVSFVLIGWFLLQAALTFNPNQAEGLGQTLNTIATQPLGMVWVALIGFGFMCYGAYCFVNARYRRIT